MFKDWMNHISPFVRSARIMKSQSLTGEWLDHDHVFTYIEQGEADFFLGGVKYAVREGDMLLMHPYMPHIINSTSSVPLIQYIFHFDLHYDETRSRINTTHAVVGNRQNHASEKEMQLASIVPIAHLQLADRIDFKKRFLLLHKEFLDSNPTSPILLKAICMEMLYVFLKSQDNPKSSQGKMTKGWPFIERAIDFIHECYSDARLDNTQISNHVGLSTSHLSHLFKKQLGVTVHSYLNHIRIEEAKRRIVEGKKTMTEIAEDVGFSGIHLFSRSFKASVGLTPSKYAASQSSIINLKV
ncbi:AraC family transcriptional regulator [Paenibacillus sp. NPDC058071]|uniref:AraC family transcriptional regulator n=1 Tax=Paenibacillus sp. NPDC058071 TaxID=3346326 RepID=UPI0036D78BE4